MQSLILRLQADVAARKRPRGEVWPGLRVSLIVVALCFSAYELGARSADSSAGLVARIAARDRIQSLTTTNEALQGRVDIQRAQIERLERAMQRSAEYGIAADLALAIEEIALAEGVEPGLAFEMVRVESEFNPRAVSPVGAIGYTQLMPATAEFFAPGITRRELFQRETNLRLGFRFFRSLLDYYQGDVRLALLAYNRGPVTVDRLLEAGVDPSNGYETMVLGREGD